MEKDDDLKRPSRQQLAIDRTHLANERTLLAYVRTFLGLTGFGVLVLRFDSSRHAVVTGVVSISIAVLILIFGIYRFHFFSKRISSEKFFIEQ